MFESYKVQRFHFKYLPLQKKKILIKNLRPICNFLQSKLFLLLQNTYKIYIANVIYKGVLKSSQFNPLSKI